LVSHNSSPFFCELGLTGIVKTDSIRMLIHEGPQPSSDGFARANQKAASYQLAAN
jgi:hypothetical protein